jgi:copper transport protein
MRRRAAVALAVLAAAGLSGTGAPAALGHAAFSGASPPPGERVESSPSRVELRFTEPLRGELSEAELVRAGGARVPARLAVRGRRMVLAPERRLDRGAYLVRWRTVSADDAHPLEGSFGFGVRTAPAAGAGSLEESPLAGGGWVRAVARGLLYGALLLFAGALLCRALLGRDWPGDPGGGPSQVRIPDPKVTTPAPPVPSSGVATLERPPAELVTASAALEERRADALVADAGLAAAALAAVAAVVDAANAAGGLSVEGLRAYLLTDTPGVARVVLVGLIVAALALARRAPRAAALAAVAGLGCVVASGHANSADPRGLAIAADWIHLTAGAVWLGGAATIAAVWRPALRDPNARAVVARDVLPRFGRVALPAFVAVAAAGAVNAIVELSSVSDLWDSAYGRVLLAKIVLVGGAAAAAYTHAFRHRRRGLAGAAARRPAGQVPEGSPPAPASPDGPLWGPLWVEVAFGAGVALLAGLLVAFPLPPRQLDAATGGLEPVPACDPCPLPAAGADELAVAGQAGSQVVAAWLRRAPQGLSGTIRTLDSRGRPATGRIDVPGGSVRPCGRGCATFQTAPAPAVLRVNVTDRGRTYAVALPATWSRGEAARARRLLERAQRTMRRLRSVREDELVSSGPGMYATTRYRLQAPDRMAFATGGGVHTVQIDRTQWLRTPGSPWRRSTIPGGVPFRTRAWFRWTPYARSAQVLSARAGTVKLAVADPATPVWMRLTVDARTGRVLRERIAARARFIDRRFHSFDRPLSILPPR